MNVLKNYEDQSYFIEAMIMIVFIEKKITLK